MAARLFSVVSVALLASSGLAWENLPSIPAGRRAEYYLQHDDGSYKFGYDTGAGQSAKVDADAANEVQGHFAYVNSEGQQVSLKYSAGEGGFVPQLEGIPSPGLRARPSTIGGSGVVPIGAPTQVADGQVDADYDANADASYSFNIDTDSYKRTESSDARGNIRGQYSYSSREGGSHGLSYVAGEGTGFVVTGGADATPAIPALYSAPAAPAGPYSGPAPNTQGGVNPDGSYAFSFSTADQSREESADAQNNVRGSYSFRAKDDGQTRRVDYSAGAATGFVASGAHLPVAPSTAPVAPFTDNRPAPGVPSLYSAPATPYSGAPTANTQGGINPDGSYSFSFSTVDQSREESADAQNNVRGSYSFRAKDDGQTRRVDYSAGAQTGFVASGAHLPVAPSAPGAPVSTYSAPAPVLPSNPSYSPSAAPATPYSGPVANTKSAINPDGSYSFSFSSDEQSREESADAQNNVRGSFSFRAKDDGQTRRVDYSAGADTGFVASGAHLPVAPSAGATPGVPAVYSAPAAIPIAPVAPIVSVPAANPYSGPASNAQGSNNLDGSYSFSYSTDDQSREESADAQNNVRGSFSFKAKDDGQTRRVDYEAGAGTGFVARGSHLPVAPSAGSPASPGRPYSVPGLVSPLLPIPARPYSAPGASGPASSSGPTADGSYSFSYNTNDQSREEAADSQGNVRGSFSFVAKDDGQRRRVDYEAGAEKGFIAKGAHLPVAPSGTPVGGSPVSGVGAVTSYQAPSSDGEDNGDASYSYSYQTDSSSKSESSDAQGNVQGQFSFIAGDGLTRKLTYTSRGDEGFIANGDHLPKAPVPVSAPGVAGGSPVGAVGSAVTVARIGATPALIPGVPAPSSAHVKSYDIRGPGFVLNKYLPPQHKTGYIFDSKA